MTSSKLQYGHRNCERKQFLSVTAGNADTRSGEGVVPRVCLTTVNSVRDPVPTRPAVPRVSTSLDVSGRDDPGVPSTDVAGVAGGTARCRTPTDETTYGTRYLRGGRGVSRRPDRGIRRSETRVEFVVGSPLSTLHSRDQGRKIKNYL